MALKMLFFSQNIVSLLKLSANFSQITTSNMYQWSIEKKHILKIWNAGQSRPTIGFVKDECIYISIGNVIDVLSRMSLINEECMYESTKRNVIEFLSRTYLIFKVSISLHKLGSKSIWKGDGGKPAKIICLAIFLVWLSLLHTIPR